MAHPDAVKAALATLARGDPVRRARPAEERPARPTSCRSDPDPGEDDMSDAAAVVDAAERAFDDVDLAADFLDEVGVQALVEAVERASGAGADDVADRGRRLLDDLEAYREAADPDDVDEDHFRPGRGTLLTGGGLAADR